MAHTAALLGASLPSLPSLSAALHVSVGHLGEAQGPVEGDVLGVQVVRGVRVAVLVLVLVLAVVLVALVVGVFGGSGGGDAADG